MNTVDALEIAIVVLDRAETPEGYLGSDHDTAVEILKAVTDEVKRRAEA